jgi:hypothetical protein
VGSRSGTTHERVSVSPRSSSFADVARVRSHRIIYLFIYETSPSPLSKQLSISSSSSGYVHIRWNSVRVNGGGLELSGASSVGLSAMQIHYVTSFSAAELRTSHCERVRKCRSRGSIRTCSMAFFARRRIGSTFDGERGRYAALTFARTYANCGT